MRTSTMPVAVVQYVPVPLDPAANLQRISKLVAESVAQGARLVVFPELACTGYVESTQLHELAETQDGPTVQALRNLSRTYGVYLVAGFVEWHQGHVYNALSMTSPNGQVAIYRKRHLVFWEHFYFRHGSDPVIVDTDFGRIGLAICADMMYQHVWDEYRGKIDLAIISAAWPKRTPQTAFRVGWMLAPSWSLAGEIPAQVARNMNVNVLFANQCGPCQVRIPHLGPATPAAFAARSGIFDHQGHRMTVETETEQIAIGIPQVDEEHLQCVILSA